MSIWLKTLMAAFSALMPEAGVDEWAAFPWKETVTEPLALPPRFI